MISFSNPPLLIKISQVPRKVDELEKKKEKKKAFTKQEHIRNNYQFIDFIQKS